jgi:hypothetical protein
MTAIKLARLRLLIFKAPEIDRQGFRHIHTATDMPRRLYVQ